MWLFYISLVSAFDPVHIKAHAFYVLPDNYCRLTYPSFAQALPVPQRYYVPRRIRETYKPKLEAVGLWDPPEDVSSPVDDAPKSFAERLKPRKEEMPQGKFKVKFGREKVCWFPFRLWTRTELTILVYSHRYWRKLALLWKSTPTSFNPSHSCLETGQFPKGYFVQDQQPS